MSLLSKDELTSLLEEQDQHCVSVYLPTHRLGADIRQGPIQLRAMLREATEQLLADGLHRPQAETLLQPAQNLLGDSSVWRHLNDGLAVFISRRLFRYYGLPRVFEPRVVVARRFFIKPLLPLLPEMEGCYVLALSQHAVHLYHGTRDALTEVPLEHAPHQVAETIQPHGHEKTLQFHTAAPTGRGRWASVYYGLGGGEVDARPKLRQFCQEVERGVAVQLKEAQAPLVLAGVDYLLSLYREVNQYPHLAEDDIIGNPERLPREELRTQAWAHSRPLARQKVSAAVAQYRQLAGSPRASERLRAIVPAACQGRVSVLFAAEGREQWGLFDATTKLIQVHSDPQPGDDDLLDLAAAHTLLEGGAVYMIPPAEMPAEGPLAAVFRY